MAQRLTPTIHAHGSSARLDAVLELIAFSAKPRPLSVSLDELPRRIAKVLSADVCSIYLLEGEDLVMRGNVGFPTAALGEVRMAVGEGITGLAVEYLRPISLNSAATHASYRHFPALGEEKFPIFLAIPIAGSGGPLGALVLQRRAAPAFAPADVELAAALTGPIAAVAERARLVDALRSGKRQGAPGGARRMTLSGRTAVKGRALGVVCALPRPDSRPAEGPPLEPAEMARTLERAVAQAQKALEGAEARAKGQGAPEADLAYLAGLRTVLEDGRVRERSLELASKGKGLGYALMDLGAETLRLASRAGNEFGRERARLISEVCEALALLCAPKGAFEMPRGAVLVGDHFSALDLLVSLRSLPVAVVLSEHTGTEATRRLLGLVQVPAVVDVSGLFKWVHPGELALVDADHGLVRLNPSRAEISAVRAQKKLRT